MTSQALFWHDLCRAGVEQDHQEAHESKQWPRESSRFMIKKALRIARLLLCGKTGIRTLGPRKGVNGFRDRPIRPLWHLSLGLAKLEDIYSSQTVQRSFVVKGCGVSMAGCLELYSFQRTGRCLMFMITKQSWIPVVLSFTFAETEQSF